MKLLKVTLVLAAAALLFAQADSTLQKAIRKETLEGDLKGAIDQYKKLAQAKDRAVAATALVRMGECYEKLGDAEARKAYERVVQEFGDQKDSVEAARVRLAAMGKTDSGPTTRLIGKGGWVVGPSLDGRFLLQSGADPVDLDLRDLQTGQTRHIAKGAWIYNAAFSPDGRRVAFFRRTQDVWELRIVGADGSAERLLWPAEKGSGGAQWFPDGKRILVTVSPGDSVSRLVAVSAADGAATTLWEGKEFAEEPRLQPQLSPDGKSVVFTRRASENPVADELWLLTLADRSESRLFQGQSFVSAPRWTPDGAGVVFLSDRRVPGAILDLWLLRTFGGKPLGLPELVKTGLGEMANGTPTIFPAGPITRDGTYYFHRVTGGQMVQLLTTKYDPDTGKAVGTPSFVSRKGGISRSPSFSRDGRWLAYLLGNPGSFPSLVIQSVESGEERVVPMTPSPGRLTWAVMFPDGRSVLLEAVDPKGKYEICRVDTASGAWTSVTKAREGEGELFPNGISPDGRTIYLNRWRKGDGNGGSWHLTALDMETGQERELRNGEWNGVGLSEDGKQLAVAHLDGKDLVIDILPVEGGSKREVYRASGVQRVADVTWTPDGRHLIFCPSDKPGSTRALVRLSVEGGAAQPIGIWAPPDRQVQFPRSFGALRVHPNGRQLVYTARGEGGESEDWALENFLPKAAK